MENMWIPHIEKTGGMTLVHSLEKTDLLAFENKDFQAYQNKGAYLYIHHNNPLKSNMMSWLKVLVVRDPIDRYISAFNFQKWRNWFRFKKVDNRNIDEFMDSYYHLSHLDFLNSKNNDLEFTMENVRSIFDFIYDVSELNKVFDLIEKRFLGKKIEWKSHNVSEKNIPHLNFHAGTDFSVFKRSDLTEIQVERLKTLLSDDILFYDYIQDNKQN